MYLLCYIPSKHQVRAFTLSFASITSPVYSTLSILSFSDLIIINGIEPGYRLSCSKVFKIAVLWKLLQLQTKTNYCQCTPNNSTLLCFMKYFKLPHHETLPQRLLAIHVIIRCGHGNIFSELRKWALALSSPLCMHKVVCKVPESCLSTTALKSSINMYHIAALVLPSPISCQKTKMLTFYGQIFLICTHPFGWAIE